MKNTVVCALAAFAALGLTGTASAAIEYDQDATTSLIFGSGVSNGSFTTDRANGVELGLRGKLRHNGVGAPENTYNSSGDGTYTFHAGVAPTQSSPTAEWSFEWTINTNYDGNGANLDQYYYVLGIDTDPDEIGTNFIEFDPINDPNPGSGGTVQWDHAMGTNATGPGDGVFIPNDPDGNDDGYGANLANFHIAQNSWKPHWFINPVFGDPGTSFDPTALGIYDFFLEAYSDVGLTNLVARTEMQVAVVPLPGAAALGFLGMGLIGLRRRFQKTHVVA